MRLLLADDHALLRRALAATLEARGGMAVVGEATTGREAVEMALELRPDVVLMDMAMPGLTGIEATRRISTLAPAARVLILSAYVEDRRLVEAVTGGAAGYVVKNADIDELVVAIASIAQGNTYFSAAVTRVISGPELAALHALGRRTPRIHDVLTDREREILQLVGEGYSSVEIAEMLVIAVKTVEAHRAHLMSKLNSSNVIDLIRHAMQRGLIELERPELEA